LRVDGRRVLVIIPDGTRTMPMPEMFERLTRELAPRTFALDFLVALGTHTPMDDAALGRLIGRRSLTAGQARTGSQSPLDDPGSFIDLGSIDSSVIADLTGGRFRTERSRRAESSGHRVRHVIICGPVVFRTRSPAFPAGPSICSRASRRPTIIHFTHWLGAVITSATVIGTAETPVRA
jgi:hypothetical protein